MDRKCYKCGKVKSLDEFSKNKYKLMGRNYNCKQCQKKYNHSTQGKSAHKKYRQTFLGKYQNYKQSAKHRNIEFDLTKDEFRTFWKQPCDYCHLEIKTIGIDRIDNSKGYILDNCISCCIKCNGMKGKMDRKDFIEHCKIISYFQTIASQ